MAMEDNAIIPGQGAVFVAEVDTPVPDLSSIDINSDLTVAVSGWDWFGHTSKDNMVALSKEGGEVTSRDSWERAGLRTEISSTSYSATVNALNVEQRTLELAWPGGTWDEETKSYGFNGNTGAVSKAVLIIMRDSKNGLAGIYFPNGALSAGEMPSLAADAFLEIQLNISGQTSPTSGEVIRIYAPRVAGAVSGDGA